MNLLEKLLKLRTFFRVCGSNGWDGAFAGR